MMGTHQENHITRGNIFDDLGLDTAEAENLKIRARLMENLIRYIRKERFSQTQAAEAFGVQQGRISYLLNGKVSKFTIDALINMHAHAGLPVHVSFEAT